MKKFHSRWQFEVGDKCYVRGWPVDVMGKIVARSLLKWPHYVVAYRGDHWLISQLELSSKPIVIR